VTYLIGDLLEYIISLWEIGIVEPKSG